jgi:hypothetical protein
LQIKNIHEEVFLRKDYKGFLVGSSNIKQFKHEVIFCSAFDGFAKNTPMCKKQKYILMKGHRS